MTRSYPTPIKPYKMNVESKMHVCLVCHTEPDVWDGRFRSIETILPKLVQMLNEVHDSTGTTPRVAWCLTSQVAQKRPDPFRELQNIGHEIGVHSHFPAASGAQEHQQELNRNNLDKFPVWFPELYSQITDAGFPPPLTPASWMFAYRDSMTRVLADMGIRIDCSVCYGGTHYLSDGFQLADSTSRGILNPVLLSFDYPVIRISL